MNKSNTEQGTQKEAVNNQRQDAKLYLEPWFCRGSIHGRGHHSKLQR